MTFTAQNVINLWNLFESLRKEFKDNGFNPHWKFLEPEFWERVLIIWEKSKNKIVAQNKLEESLLHASSFSKEGEKQKFHERFVYYFSLYT
jgi:hypothetical protein